MFIARSVVCFPDIFGWVDKCDGEHGSGIIKQVPLRRVSPVASTPVWRSTARGGWADNHVDFLCAIRAGGIPVPSIFLPVDVALMAELSLISDCDRMVFQGNNVLPPTADALSAI